MVHMICRYLWRGKHTFAIAQHKHHHSIYEEADAIKRRKRYARPLIDLHMKIYNYEGMKPWSAKEGTISGKRGSPYHILVFILNLDLKVTIARTTHTVMLMYLLNMNTTEATFRP